MLEPSAAVRAGETALGIEFGSTRIKAVLIDMEGRVLASGGWDWENQFVDRTWTYPLDLVWAGLQGAYRSLSDRVISEFGVTLTTVGSIGISAMMHGYLVFDREGDQLIPFRTWRNNMTEDAAEMLSRRFGFNIPQRWCVAHLAQAILNEESHVVHVAHLTTLAGLVHWKLTGERVVGVGDASGMFPIDPQTAQFDDGMLTKFDEAFELRRLGWKVRDVLPEVLKAGMPAGVLSEAGARLLDPSGILQAGIPLAPPEGDGATGMVATNSVLPGTGNTSVGTSIFAMVVMDRPLRATHKEVDIINTPTGKPVAMVHCNNGANEVNAWAGVFGEFAHLIGAHVDSDSVFSALLSAALEGDADCGGLLAYNYLAGEVITNFNEGRPLFVRAPESAFTLANFARAQIFGVFGTLALGMRLLRAEETNLGSMVAHGGLFRTKGVAQRLLAAALNTRVAVAETAGEGGAWGMAVLAAYLQDARGLTLDEYLEQVVFSTASLSVVEPNAVEAQGFSSFLERYEKALTIMRAAVEAT